MKSSKAFVTTSAIMLIIGFVFPTYAQSEKIPSRGPIPFAAYDKDANGLVSEEEFNKVRGERMSSRATKGRAMRGAGNAPAFSDFDNNSDGQLTRDELIAGQKTQMQKHRNSGMQQHMPSFADFDLNGDGKVHEKELYEARNKRIRNRVQQGYQMKNLGNAPSFKEIDLNGDGHINKKEFSRHKALHRQQRSQ